MKIFSTDLKIKNALIKIALGAFLGGLCHVICLYIALKINQTAFVFISNPFIAILFSGVGGYFSFSDLKYFSTAVVSVFLLIIASKVLFYDFLLHGLCDFSQNIVLHVLFTTLVGIYVGASLKSSILWKKENPLPKRTPLEEYERMKNYKMNSVIRPLGVIVGVLFVVCPFLIIHKLAFELSEINLVEIIFFIFFLFGSFLMGLFFLAYCIPGKTPEFILKNMKNKIKENDDN